MKLFNLIMSTVTLAISIVLVAIGEMDHAIYQLLLAVLFRVAAAEEK
jgi:hypothetical protein